MAAKDMYLNRSNSAVDTIRAFVDELRKLNVEIEEQIKTNEAEAEQRRQDNIELAKLLEDNTKVIEGIGGFFAEEE